MSKRKDGELDGAIQECRHCERSMLSAYIENGLCYRCRETDDE